MAILVGIPISSRISVAASDAASDADYTCDGTDDEVQINAAIAALPATGGLVVLSDGTFNISSPILIEDDNVTLIGAGAGQRTGATQTGAGTKLKAASTISGQIIKVQRAADDRPVYGVQLSSFTVDGNSQGTAVDGILFRSNRGHINHVHVHYCTGNGMRVQGYASWDTYDTTLGFVQTGDCTAAGILVDEGGADCHFTNCISYNNGYGMVVKASSMQVTACHFYDSTTNNIKFDGGGSRSKIVNCKIEGAGQHGINIDSTNGGYSDIQIIGNGLSNNGDSANNTYDHIFLQGPSGNGISRTQIIGNSLGSKSGATNKVRYGINMSSTACQSTVIIGNSFGPSPYYLPGSTAQLVTGPINDGSSGSFPAQIKSNAGAADDPTASRPIPTTYTTAQVQTELTAAGTSGEQVVFLPGTHSYGALTIPDRVVVTGCGLLTTLTSTAGGATFITLGSQASLRDMKLLKGGTLREAGSVAVDVSDEANTKVTDVRIESFETGYKQFDTANASFYNSSRDLVLFDNLRGMDFGGSQANSNRHYNTRIRPIAANASAIGIRIVDARGLQFSGFNIESTGTAANNGTGITIDATSRGCLFDGGWVENHVQGLTVTSGAVRMTFSNVTFTSSTTDVTNNGTNTVFINCETTGTRLHATA